MRGDISVRLAGAEDAEEVSSLLDLVFNGWPGYPIGVSRVDHYRWKYRGMCLGSDVGIVAEHGGKIIGALHSSHHRLKLYDRVVPAATGGDVCVHPEYRGKGVFTVMDKYYDKVHEEARGSHIVHFITGNPVVIRKKLKDRDLLPHGVCNMVWINDLALHLRNAPVDYEALVKTGYSALKAINKVGNLISSSRYESTDLDFKEVSEFPEEVDVFWERVSRGYDLITVRDREYLNWRFMDSRTARHHCVVACNKEGELLGYVLYARNYMRNGYAVGYIVDLLTLPGMSYVAYALLEKALAFFTEKQVNVVNYLMVDGHPYGIIARKLQFLDSRVNIHVFIRHRHKEVESLRSNTPARLYFSWGDHDSLPLTVRRL